jgi:hypothetical protein
MLQTAQRWGEGFAEGQSCLDHIETHGTAGLLGSLGVDIQDPQCSTWITVGDLTNDYNSISVTKGMFRL